MAKRITETLAIVCLILNILIMPGLGTLIGRKTKQGIWQLVLFFGGISVGLFLLTTNAIEVATGFLLMIIGPIIAWIWGIASGIQLIQEVQ